MIKILLFLFALMLAAGCAAESGSDGPLSVPKTSDKKTLPNIVIDGSAININGAAVWLGDTLDSWKRVLGGSSACYDAGSIVTCVWHSTGLSLGTDHLDKTRVKFMLLDLTIEPAEFGERAPSWPQSPFRGTLELDGILIYSTTAFRDLRRQVPVARELRCGGSDCGNPSAAFSDGASIHMNLARRSENAPILSFSISCTRTRSCTALIPRRGKK